MKRRNALPADGTATVMEQAVFLARLALGDAPRDDLAHPFGLNDPPVPLGWRVSRDYWDRLLVECRPPELSVGSVSYRLLGLPIRVDASLPPASICLDPLR